MDQTLSRLSLLLPSSYVHTHYSTMPNRSSSSSSSAAAGSASTCISSAGAEWKLAASSTETSLSSHSASLMSDTPRAATSVQNSSRRFPSKRFLIDFRNVLKSSGSSSLTHPSRKHTR